MRWPGSKASIRRGRDGERPGEPRSSGLLSFKPSLRSSSPPIRHFCHPQPYGSYSLLCRDTGDALTARSCQDGPISTLYPPWKAFASRSSNGAGGLIKRNGQSVAIPMGSSPRPLLQANQDLQGSRLGLRWRHGRRAETLFNELLVTMITNYTRPSSRTPYITCSFARVSQVSAGHPRLSVVQTRGWPQCMEFDTLHRIKQVWACLIEHYTRG